MSTNQDNKKVLLFVIFVLSLTLQVFSDQYKALPAMQSDHALCLSPLNFYLDVPKF
jgi:hypothetical protein